MKKFIILDEKKTGFVTPEELKRSMYTSNLLTPKEINIIMRRVKEEPFEYRNFQEILFEIRFELAKSRIMDTNID